MKQLVRVYADESCLGVQFTDRDSPGGAGGLVEYHTDSGWVRRDYWVSEPATTNNRMAIRSAIEPLCALKRPCRVILTSDSNYLVRGMREWVPGWIRRDWKRREGPVGNRDLWEELIAAWRRHEVDPRWVRGHAGHPQNEYANHLATRAAKKQDASGGLVPSGYTEWLERHREKGRYLDVFEFQPPESEDFRPSPTPPRGSHE